MVATTFFAGDLDTIMPYIKFQPLETNDLEIIDGALLHRVSIERDEQGNVKKAYVYFGNDEFAIDAESAKELEKIIHDQAIVISVSNTKNWEKFVEIDMK